MKKLVVILGIIIFFSFFILRGTATASNDALNKDWNFLIINKTNKTLNDIIQEEFELKTPITKVAGFYHFYSDENTLIWTKKIPKAKKYTTFILTGLGEPSEGWAEGSSFKTQTSKAWVNLIVNDTNGAPLRGIPLTNGTELNNKNIGGTWYTNDKKHMLLHMVNYF